jgi:hypothetical protein
VTDEPRPQPEPGGAGNDPIAPPDPALETLRDILFRHDRQRIAELEAEIHVMEQRGVDRDALIETISPVLGEALRRQIAVAREEMVETLYPLIGQLVVRAVSDAVRDLARTVDAQVRRSFELRAAWWRIRARLGGASDAEMSLRTSLPFKVNEVFLIHRESGLLLWHRSREAKATRDSELVGSMLTAIRDFAYDAFGRGKGDQLEEIEYGDERILLEAASNAYLAVVVDGVEPPGFRVEMRERIVDVEHRYARVLRDYDGDATRLAAAEGILRPLMSAAEPPRMTTAQKWLMAAVAGVAAICLVAACFAGSWGLSALRGTPTPLPVAVQAAASHTPSPSATPSPMPTWTPRATLTPSPSPSLTFTATPTSSFTPTVTPSPTSTSPSPVMGLMMGNVWLRQEPGDDAARFGVVAERGAEVEILAVSGDWCQIRLSRGEGVEATGWVPLRWVGTLGPIPEHLISPAASP